MEPPDGFQERVLRGLLGVHVVPENAVRHSVHHVLVLAHEPSDRALVTRSCKCYGPVFFQGDSAAM